MKKVLICDLVGLKLDHSGCPDHSEVAEFIRAQGGVFHKGGVLENAAEARADAVNFYYLPYLSSGEEMTQAGNESYDAVIAAATFIPSQARFSLGGVRIGAGTGNMGSASWGGGTGVGGSAPLMNTPGSNSRATAQMVMKAILSVMPDLPLDDLHDQVLAGRFDTRVHIQAYPTEKLEGKRLAVLGFGNIGREVARLAKAFQMNVTVYARSAHKERILNAGFDYSDDPVAACVNADILSVHVGLGQRDATSGSYLNCGIVGAPLLKVMRPGAIVVNFDRGEVVDVAALSDAMQVGQVRYAFIDADIFCDAKTGRLSGPLAPYIEPARQLGGRMKLYPHIAADTDHPSRVAGAKQAVLQIIEAMCNKRVRNLVGDLPDGYKLAVDEAANTTE
ncbi:phosphoglycerate dehydrogenase [Ochrobactrum sp. Q0168]|uniref:NAD(P)-dependent oxidoreductase n=1 Tax=Ochrobactrum sp. Q0168 TaxID=2793241 RepID=UPI0018EDDB43|nr:phosphoglycerate dehydrogenase [Ochrobactrum sp. Q0168]